MKARRLVLTIDDNLDLREIVSTVLRDRGFDSLEAARALEGVALAKAHQPDLIFLDLMMPAVDGWTAVAALKDDPSTREIPVVAISAMDASVSEIRDAGFCAFLRKPVGPSAVVKAVEICLAARSRNESWTENLNSLVSGLGG